jgi:HSP20 family protein
MSTTIAQQKPESVSTLHEEHRVREPHYSILDQSNHFRVEIALPGAPKKSVKIEQKGDEITVLADRQNWVPENWKPLHRRIESCTYRLNLQLGHTVDSENISANYNDGMLLLRVPKQGHKPDRTITVN